MEGTSSLSFHCSDVTLNLSKNSVFSFYSPERPFLQPKKVFEYAGNNQMEELSRGIRIRCDSNSSLRRGWTKCVAKMINVYFCSS